MVNPTRFPQPFAHVLNPDGSFTKEWRDFFLELPDDIDLGALGASLRSLDQRVDVLEHSGGITASIQGLGSVRVDGTLQNGVVQIMLYGDVDAPGVTYFYGTGPTGDRGFWRLHDSMEAGVGIVRTDSGYVVVGEVETPAELPPFGQDGQAYRVLDPGQSGLWVWDGAGWVPDPNATGVVGFRLAELADSGAGTLLAITRDVYGRVAGTKDATITGTFGEIDVANGDASVGLPTLSLANVDDAGGGALLKTAFDSKGRKTGSSAATTDDLAEGGTNLYYTDERAVAALDASGKLIRFASFGIDLDPTDLTYIVISGPTPPFPGLEVVAVVNVFATGSGLYLMSPTGADPTLSGYFDLPSGETISNISDARVYSSDGRLWSPAASFTPDGSVADRVQYTGGIGFIAQTLPQYHPDLTPIPVEPMKGVAGNGFVLSLTATDPFTIFVVKTDSTTYSVPFKQTDLSAPVQFRVYRF